MKRFVLLSGLFLMFVVASLYAQEGQAEKPAEGPWTKSIPLKAEDTLVVYVDPGSVQIIPWEKKEIAVTAQGVLAADQEKIQFTSKNKNVRLDFRGDKTATVTFVVQVPSTFNIDSYSGGDVEVKAPLSGKLKFKTNAGGVTLEDVSGTLVVDSSEGDVYVGNVKGDATLTTNGEIEANDITGNLELKNESGDSFVKSVGGNANARVSDGDLTIGDIGGNLTASAGIGDIDFQKVGGMATVNTESGDIDFFEGTGMIIAQTNSGDIYLRKVIGAVDARTEDGDISAEMFSGSGGASKFYTRDGDIEILFSQDAKATVDAKITGTGIDEDDEPLTSDWPAVNDKNKLSAKYEINGGGDSILAEAVNGEIFIKKLTPKPQPAAKKTNQ
jgi:hypothetical protein